MSLCLVIRPAILGAIGLLDRLSRNLAFIATLMDSGTKFVIARKLTCGNSVAIPAIAQTKNMRRYRKDSWLGDLDSNQD
jgi:hypothetical protein